MAPACCCLGTADMRRGRSAHEEGPIFDHPPTDQNTPKSIHYIGMIPKKNQHHHSKAGQVLQRPLPHDPLCRRLPGRPVRDHLCRAKGGVHRGGRVCVVVCVGGQAREREGDERKRQSLPLGLASPQHPNETKRNVTQRNNIHKHNQPNATNKHHSNDTDSATAGRSRRSTSCGRRRRTTKCRG